ncbi:hypothetical protein [Micromonospora craniellae]|uniref:Uncharacterized protein n=1 Tax=Micromonospora craniellae TaxID=2294034 RepID=A0A372G057_9ACTN|nr:hypothetical protein [Micromonospora craniellae]QOC94668.1 hypothetical protein ID554_14625 [Micromonospora craniellae]RFS46457.1 hypothetical protein D0Q02_11920 [Micromonospora craniellae]
MTDIRRALGEVWHAEPGGGRSGPDPLPAVRARLRRRRRVQATAVASAVCTVLGLGVFTVVAAGRPASPPRVAAPSGSAASELRGLPVYLRPADPTEAVLRMARPQVVPNGDRVAYEGAGPVTRVVAVFDFEAALGLPGVPREVTVATAAQVLATDDLATSTAYLSAWRSDGRTLFVSVTGDTPQVRTAALDALVEANLH